MASLGRREFDDRAQKLSAPAVLRGLPTVTSTCDLVTECVIAGGRSHGSVPTTAALGAGSHGRMAHGCDVWPGLHA